MKQGWWIAALGAAMVAGCAQEPPQAATAVAKSADGAGPRTAAGHPPRHVTRFVSKLQFEANVGQAAQDVRFLSRGMGYTLSLTPTGAVFDLSSRPTAARAQAGHDVVRIGFAGGNPSPAIEGVDREAGHAHYFIGNDARNWHPNVDRFARVRYRQVYSGIDVVFYGNDNALEYDFVVAPKADPNAIAVAFDGVRSMRIDAAGNLVLATAHGELVQHKPVAYQELGGQRVAVEGRYAVLSDHRVGFQVGRYDDRAPLVIDPMFGFGTNLPGNDTAAAIAIDADGNSYVAGFSGNDALIARYDAAGVQVDTVYLGGSGADRATGIALDAAGNLLVSGKTASTDFPLAAAAQATYGGGPSDLFVAKLAVDGSGLVYSTYLGGSDDEPDEPEFHAPYWPSWGGNTIAVDGDGNAYVTGTTSSTNFPTVAALQPSSGFQTDAFVTKFDPAGSIVYSTYLGGRYNDFGHAIAVDGEGRVFVAGGTWSPDFPTVSPYQAATTHDPLAGGWNEDAFVARIAADGSALDYSTYLGGEGGDERAWGVAVDAVDNVYLVGQTWSADFPTQSAGQACQGKTGDSWGDAFVTKLDASGASLGYSTCLGGAVREDAGYAIAVDANGKAYVTGHTDATDFPTVHPLQATRESVPAGWDLHDAFVSELEADGTLSFSTYFNAGTLGPDAGYGIAVDADGNAYVAGLTQCTCGGGFVARIDAASGLSVSDVAFTEGDGETIATLKVQLTSPSDTPVTFDFATVAGTATAGVDYEDVSALGLVIEPGQTEKTITLPIHGDQAVEGDETFGFGVANVSGAVVVQDHATATIRNDDAIVSVDDVAGVEGNAGTTRELVVPVRLSAPLPTPVNFSVRVEGGTATAGNDFVAFSGTQTFAPGTQEVDFYVTLDGDNTIEPDENLHFIVSDVDGAIAGKLDGTLTIRNDDTKVSVADVSVIEGASGTKQAVFTVKLSNPSAAPVTYDIATANKTASSGTDYVAKSLAGQSIPAGATSKTFAVTYKGDTVVEPTETFLVNLSGVSGATVAGAQAVGTIRNDDTVLRIADVRTAEGNAGTKVATFTVTLSAVSVNPVKFNIATANKTATAGTDFVARSLSGQAIAAGATSRTFAVTLKGDTKVEANETYVVNVTGVTGATVGDGQAIGTIVNDD